MTQKLCIDCRWHLIGALPSGALDKCTNPVFIELASSDPVRGNITRVGGGNCQELRKDLTHCGPQASKWESLAEEMKNG